MARILKYQQPMKHLQLLATTTLLMLAGCGESALRSVSSGYVGCSPDEIEITNDDIGFSNRSWDAACHGRIFHCSGAGKVGMSCVEDRPPVDETLRAVTASRVGCPVDEVEVSRDKPGFNRRSWEATCRGHAFYCFAVARKDISCIDEMAVAPKAASSGTPETLPMNDRQTLEHPL